MKAIEKDYSKESSSDEEIPKPIVNTNRKQRTIQKRSAQKQTTD